MAARNAGARGLANVLAYAPVPVAAGRYIQERYDPDKDRKLFNLAFKVLSHLLANGTEHYITRGGFHVLGTSKNHSDHHDQVNLLVNAGIIEVAQEAVWDGPDKTARVFRIPDRLFQMMLDSVDSRSFATAGAILSRNYFKASSTSQIHSSIAGQAALEPGLDGTILALQQRPLRFDRLGFLAWLRAEALERPMADLRRMFSAGYLLADGDNYTKYRLARTGRVLTMAPNLQGIPKVLRGPWFFPTEGSHFLDFDFTSQEAHIIAHLSDDDALKRSLAKGLYEIVAAILDKTRDEVKPLVNAYFYGAGRWGLARIANGLSDTMKPTPEALALAAEFTDFMRGTFPATVRWMHDRGAIIKTSGCASSVGGFERSEIPPSKASTVGVNHIIQGTGADILRMVLRTLHTDLGPEARVLLPMHDGLLVEVADPDDGAAVIIEGAMHATVERILPGLRIPVKIQRGWREKGVPEPEANRRPSRFDGAAIAA